MDAGTDATTVEWLPITEAADRLGLRRDALRKRVARGSVRAEKRGDQWFVHVGGTDAGRTVSHEPGRTSGADSGADTSRDTDRLIAALEAEVAFLRAQLINRDEEVRRAHQLLAAAVST